MITQSFLKSLPKSLKLLPKSMPLLLLAVGAFAQANPAPTNPPATPTATTPVALDPTTAVITIKGLCPQGSPANTSPDCKTVISKGDFDHLLEVAGPNMPAGMRRQLAENYSRSVVRSRAAEALNLDQQPRFQEQMRLVRLQVLSSFLSRAIQPNARPRAR